MELKTLTLPAVDADDLFKDAMEFRKCYEDFADIWRDDRAAGVKDGDKPTVRTAAQVAEDIASLLHVSDYDLEDDQYPQGLLVESRLKSLLGVDSGNVVVIFMTAVGWEEFDTPLTTARNWRAVVEMVETLDGMVRGPAPILVRSRPGEWRRATLTYGSVLFDKPLLLDDPDDNPLPKGQRRITAILVD